MGKNELMMVFIGGFSQKFKRVPGVSESPVPMSVIALF